MSRCLRHTTLLMNMMTLAAELNGITLALPTRQSCSTLRDAPNHPEQQAAHLEVAFAAVRPVLEYLKSQSSNEYESTFLAFRIARLCNPRRIRDTHNDFELVSKLRFVDGKLKASLHKELPIYLARANAIGDNDLLGWWKRNEAELPSWALFLRKSLLLQPSSAAVERVFSMLSNCFDDAQERALNDYIESSLMLRFNAFRSSHE